MQPTRAAFTIGSKLGFSSRIAFLQKSMFVPTEHSFTSQSILYEAIDVAVKCLTGTETLVATLGTDYLRDRARFFRKNVLKGGI